MSTSGPAAPPATPSPLASPEPWDHVADGYVSEVVPQFEPYARDALGLAGVVAGDEVADVACGPGTLALLAAADGVRVAALDFSPAMIERLDRLAAARGVAKRIDAVVGDGQALPWADGRFAAGFSLFGLMFFPDRARGFGELRRVVRPGGRLVVSSWRPSQQVPPLAALFAALGAALPGVPFGVARAPLGEPEELAAEMTAAGLAAVEVHDIVHRSEVAGVEAFVDSLERSMAPLALLKRKLGEGWPAVSAAVRRRLVDELGDRPFELGLRALVGVGVVPDR
jgi:ubiquinone/menaquinone biosynthesis C-methylase UbiE